MLGGKGEYSMKAKKVLLGLSVAILGVAAVAVGIDATAKTSKTIAKTDAAQTEVDFTTANITRRVYFVDNKDNWWEGKSLELHVWGGSLQAEQYVDAVKMNNSYYWGLYYADITGVGAGSAINAQAHVKGYADAQWWSVGQTLPSLGSKTEDVIWLNNGTGEGGNRNASIGSAGGTCDQVASFLDFISTCTTSYASGYNAYPQLKANFLDPSSAAIAQWGDVTPVEGGTTYYLSQKIAKLESLFNENGWKVKQ